MSTKISLSQLPQLIKIEGSTYTSKFSTLPTTLECFKNDYGLDLDPDFQRGHVWSKDNQIKFIEFILKGGKSPPLYFNSPCYRQSSSENKLPDTIVLVDGKQRLNAILSFINNEIPVFGYYLNDFEDKVFLLRHFSISYYINSLQTRKEVLQWYLELNEGHIAHSKEEIERVKVLLEKA